MCGPRVQMCRGCLPCGRSWFLFQLRSVHGVARVPALPGECRSVAVTGALVPPFRRVRRSMCKNRGGFVGCEGAERGGGRVPVGVMGCSCGARGERASLSTDLGRWSVRTSQAGPTVQGLGGRTAPFAKLGKGGSGRSPCASGAELQPRTWTVAADWLCVSV